MNKLRIAFILGFIALVGFVYFQQKRITSIKVERDRQITNNDALLSEQRQWKIDSTTMATDVKSLRFTIDEMERYRAKDLAQIKNMGIKIRTLEATAKHQLQVEAQIKAPIRDTIIIRDLQPIPAKQIQMTTPHISINAIMENDSLVGSIRLPVTLQQAVWVEYKRCWIFWKKAVGVHQTVISDNPHVKIKYSEYIKIQK